MIINNKPTPLERFYNLLKPDYTDIKNIYVYSIFKGLLSLSLPLGIQALINFIHVQLKVKAIVFDYGIDWSLGLLD